MSALCRILFFWAICILAMDIKEQWTSFFFPFFVRLIVPRTLYLARQQICACPQQDVLSPCLPCREKRDRSRDNVASLQKKDARDPSKKKRTKTARRPQYRNSFFLAKSQNATIESKA